MNQHTGEVSSLPSFLRHRWVRILLLAVFSFTTFFVHNSVLRPDLMEVRNLVTAHEMVTDGHWLVPTMNGQYRLEKPPFPTWVSACIESLFGDNLSMQRAAAGIMGLLMAFFLFRLVVKMSGRRDTALVATLMLMTCYNIILQGRTITWDIYCHAFMMGGIYYLYRALYEDIRPWIFFLAAFFMGLSFMSKGPVSFFALLLPSLIALLIWRRPNMRGRWLLVLGMLSVILLMSAWWYVYVYLQVPEATRSIVGKETSSWVDHNVRPWWYYWRFFLETGVWAPLLLYVLFRTLKGWKEEDTTTRIAWLWTIAGVILLSLFPEKKMRYLLPLMIPCCILMASWICKHWPVRYVRRLMAVVCILFALVECLALPFVSNILGYEGRRSLTELKPIVERHSNLKVCFLEQPDHLFRIDMAYYARNKVELEPLERLAGYLNETSAPLMLMLPKDYDIANLPALSDVTVQDYGVFDNNPYASSNKHYNTSLISRVVLIEPLDAPDTAAP